jgi:hypothetical protein
MTPQDLKAIVESGLMTPEIAATLLKPLTVLWSGMLDAFEADHEADHERKTALLADAVCKINCATTVLRCTVVQGLPTETKP